MKLIFDNSTLVVLLDRLYLTNEIDQLSKKHELIIPKRVFEEFCVKSNEQQKALIYRYFKIVEVAGNAELIPLLEGDSGEFFVLSHGLQLQSEQADFYCVIDEEIGRSVCDTFELPKKGAIGILRLMADEKILDKAQLINIKEKILKSDFRMPKGALDWIN